MVTQPNEISAKDIVAFRKENGLSQQDLAQMLGVSLPSVKRWETGKSTPRDRHLLALKTVLGETTSRNTSKVVYATHGLGMGPLGNLLAHMGALALSTIGRMTAGKGTVSSLDQGSRQRVSEELWRVLEQVSVHFPIPRAPEDRAKADKVKLEVEVDRVLFDKFQEEASFRGFTQSRLVEAMLWLLLEMPPLSFQEHVELNQHPEDCNGELKGDEPEWGYT